MCIKKQTKQNESKKEKPHRREKWVHVFPVKKGKINSNWIFAKIEKPENFSVSKSESKVIKSPTTFDWVRTENRKSFFIGFSEVFLPDSLRLFSLKPTICTPQKNIEVYRHRRHHSAIESTSAKASSIHIPCCACTHSRLLRNDKKKQKKVVCLWLNLLNQFSVVYTARRSINIEIFIKTNVSSSNYPKETRINLSAIFIIGHRFVGQQYTHIVTGTEWLTPHNTHANASPSSRNVNAWISSSRGTYIYYNNTEYCMCICAFVSTADSCSRCFSLYSPTACIRAWKNCVVVVV